MTRKAKPTVNIDIDVGSHISEGGDNEFLTNPAKFLGTSKPKRKSQITKKAPSKRLVSRRRKNTEQGYFPNPVDEKIYSRPSKTVGKGKFRFAVEMSENGKTGWISEGIFPSQQKAFVFARDLDKKHGNKKYIRVVIR